MGVFSKSAVYNFQDLIGEIPKERLPSYWLSPLQLVGGMATPFKVVQGERSARVTIIDMHKLTMDSTPTRPMCYIRVCSHS